MSKNVKEWIIFLLIAIVVAFLISLFIRPTIVKQSSMEPTFDNGDYIFVSKQSYGLFGQDPERGDVIVFKSHLETEDGDEKLLIKRVIGIPGDNIIIKDGYVYLNGSKLEENYLKEQGITTPYEEDLTEKSFTVPEKSVFVMGDNRRVSVDSRSVAVGFVPVDDIYGKVVLRAFPFDKISTF